MGDLLMMGMFATSSLMAIIMGGVNASTKQKDVDSAAQAARDAALKFATAAGKTVADCEFNVNVEEAKISDLWETMTAANAKLNVSKRNFRLEFNTMSIIVVIVIIGVFFLLILKKLNLFTFDPLNPINYNTSTK